MSAWKYTDSMETSVFRVLQGGQYQSVSVSDPEFQTWLQAGNTPDPADPAVVPADVCSPWQMRKALNAQGIRQAVEDAVAASSDQIVKDGWAFATEFRSDDPFVISMGATVGKTPAETAALIKYAAGL